ncbi:short-chain dehydrogenase [Paenibacillus pectinilyticus]|uniref:Short-chain dehydrogenase n=1 Tax=Paenibacillus pectinilyticus TaxID=512399 RepID=A0A1C1A4D1_9BACL|nr:SDR family NAD(P)-dependent oxidoreductase [Paenibacillus pectinilyticus]OCT15413.1 short-chain dehydrogenase [Paenibacillus pectinilyticus]
MEELQQFQEFKGKVALVTGGTKGIGFGAARRLAQGGCSVVICGSRTDDGEEAASMLRNEQLEVRFKHADVRYSDKVQELIRFTIATYGRLDILVNSAGVQRYGDATETSEFVWDEVLDINLKGMFLTSKYAIPEMRKAGKGAIVNVSSVQAFASQKGVVAYTASKGGINAMTRAMALDHAHEQIRVNVVCPASVDTPMLRWAADQHKGEQTQEEVLASWGNMHPIGRVGTMEEVGELIAFLASDKAGFITGAEYKIDGGMLAALGVHLPE